MKSLPEQAAEPSTLPVSRARKMREKVAAVAAEAVPLDRLQPAGWNPRTIKDERFQNLVRSFQADPDFLGRRPILATADGAIYAGSMRYRAAQHRACRPSRRSSRTSPRRCSAPALPRPPPMG